MLDATLANIYSKTFSSLPDTAEYLITMLSAYLLSPPLAYNNYSVPYFLFHGFLTVHDKVSSLRFVPVHSATPGKVSNVPDAVTG